MSSIINPQRAAERVLDELSITDPADLNLLELIALERGATVQYQPLYGSEARISIIEDSAIITVSSNIKNERRQRFSIAHELGHFEMHRHKRQLALCTQNDIDECSHQVEKTKSYEREANEFAISLLLPKKFFKPPCEMNDPSMGEIVRLSSIYNTSLTATALRYMEYTLEACAVVFSQNGIVQWFRPSEEFKELGLFVEIHCRPSTLSGVSSYFKNQIMSERQRRIQASAWLSDGKYRKNATILEQSLAMPVLNAVLTLLWVDDDIEEDYW